MFNNAKQIRDSFVRNGWNESVLFEELSMQEAKEKGYLFAIDKINKGRKYFKMNVCGNIYDDNGRLVLLNIQVKS